jgi:hypothetical protein
MIPVSAAPDIFYATLLSASSSNSGNSASKKYESFAFGCAKFQRKRNIPTLDASIILSRRHSIYGAWREVPFIFAVSALIPFDSMDQSIKDLTRTSSEF